MGSNSPFGNSPFDKDGDDDNQTNSGDSSGPEPGKPADSGSSGSGDAGNGDSGGGSSSDKPTGGDAGETGSSSSSGSSASDKDDPSQFFGQIPGFSQFPGFGFVNVGDMGNEGGSGQGQGFDMNALGQMLTQLGQVLRQGGAKPESDQPVNYDLAKQLALQQLDKSDSPAPSEEQRSAVQESVHLAELWLDPTTALPAGTHAVEAWSPREWVEKTLPTWQRLCDPVARQMSQAWIHALPAEAAQQVGPLMSMFSQMGGMTFGSQLGSGLAQLATEVLTSTEVGLPLGSDGTAVMVPANVERFVDGLERPRSETMVFLAAREAAHHRLFTHVPWLKQRLLGTVEEFARGIRVDTSGFEDLASKMDISDMGAMQEALSSMSTNILEPQTTPEQQSALNRLETLLALIEGWVDVVVGEAVGQRLPGAEALAETMRRRRASGGPAEETFKTLVGMELRPRQLRAAATLWKLLTERYGIDGRDRVWEHPDLLPSSDDLAEPLDFADRWGASPSDLDDPIAAIREAEEAEKREKDRDEKNDGDSGQK